MKKYPRVHQIGFVVDDMERAMEEYGRIYHIRTWYETTRKPDDKMYYHGNRIVDDGFIAVIGYCGATEIELIATNAEHSLYADFLKENGPGLHHVSFFCKDLRVPIYRFTEMGYDVVQNGEITGRHVKTDYVYMAKKEEGYSRIVEFSSSRLFGSIPVIRNRHLMKMGCVSGDLRKLRTINTRERWDEANY